MPTLNNVGPVPTDPGDFEKKSTFDDILQGGVSRDYVAGRAAVLAGPKATKADTDTKDGAFAEPSYYTARDALLIPNSAKGVANGVATLVSSKIPLAQCPNLGTGMVRGPYGPTSQFAGSTGATPLKIAEWNLGQSGLSFEAECYITAMITSTGRPAIEVKIGVPSQTTYASQVQIGYGEGRSYYKDLQTVSVIPASAFTGEMQDGVASPWPPNMDVRVTAWLYDVDGGNSSIATGMIVSGSVYLNRTSL